MIWHHPYANYMIEHQPATGRYRTIRDRIAGAPGLMSTAWIDSSEMTESSLHKNGWTPHRPEDLLEESL